MIPLDKDRAERLIVLAKQRFDSDLLPVELKILHESASSDELQIPDDPKSRSQVRPEFLRWLATDTDAAESIDPRGIRIVSATIAGALDLSFCRISRMLVFHSCTFQDHLLLLHSELRGLGIYNSSLTEGIIADGATIRGPVFLGAGFHSSGLVNFHSARIEGGFTCYGALLPIKGPSLTLEGARVGGQVALTNGFRSCGEIRIIGSTIDGDLACRDAFLSATAGGNALSLDRACVRGKLELSLLNASAALSLNGIEVGGQLDCNGSIIGSFSIALSLDGARLQDYVCLKGLRATGEIRLVGARLASSLDCSGVVLKTTGNALRLDRAEIRGSVLLNNLRSDGVVRIAATSIGNNLYCGGATLPELYCLNMKLDGDLWWGGIQKAEHTKLNLTGAVLRNLRDEKESWPSRNNLKLNALTYEGLRLHTSVASGQWETNNLPDPSPLDGKERIEWLKLQGHSKQVEPQPWFQLSKILDAHGKKKDAKHVIYTMRLEQARSYTADLHWWNIFTFIRRGWNIVVAWLEENLFRVGWTLAALIILGCGLFWYARHAIAPTDRTVYLEWAGGQPFQSAYPKFQPLIYTIENAVPIVKLGQDDKWGPDPNYRPISCYWFLSSSRWFLIAAGWFQATLLAAAINQRFRS
jgi:hypothetical protein